MGVPGFLVTKRIRMEGFVVMDFYNRRKQAEDALAGWLDSGQLKAPVDIVEGFEKMPSALTGMFAGKNRGKADRQGLMRLSRDGCATSKPLSRSPACVA